MSRTATPPSARHFPESWKYKPLSRRRSCQSTPRVRPALRGPNRPQGLSAYPSDPPASPKHHSQMESPDEDSNLPRSSLQHSCPSFPTPADSCRDLTTAPSSNGFRSRRRCAGGWTENWSSGGEECMQPWWESTTLTSSGCSPGCESCCSWPPTGGGRSVLLRSFAFET